MAACTMRPRSWRTAGMPTWGRRPRRRGTTDTRKWRSEPTSTHYLMTNKKDGRLYNAAQKLADCWYANLGPAPKKTWYDGHQEMEQALVRLDRKSVV